MSDLALHPTTAQLSSLVAETALARDSDLPRPVQQGAVTLADAETLQRGARLIRADAPRGLTLAAPAVARTASKPLPDRNFVVQMNSPTQRVGFEQITVESTIPFPRYDDPAWSTDGALYNLKEYPPLSGTVGRLYRNGNAAVFEIDIEFHTRYFHQIVYYPDLTNPVPHLYAKFGVGSHFKEFPIDARYKPQDLFF